MTICNMTIEGGARAGMIAPDDTTFAYLEGRPGAPSGAAWEQALEGWRALRTDDGRRFDREVEVDVAALIPQVTWGTNPGMVAPIDGSVPDPASYDDPADREAVERALHYMGLEPGTPFTRDPGRARLHRLLHELADRGSPRRRLGGRGPPCRRRRPRDGRSRLGEGQAPGRGRGPRPRVHSPPASSGARRAARCASG